MAGLTAVVTVRVPEPQFEAQTKVRLMNPEVQSFIEQVVYEKFTNFLEENPGEAKRIVTKGIQAAQAREAARSGAIEDLVAWRTAAAGDTFLVPAGTVHAIGAGLTLIGAIGVFKLQSFYDRIHAPTLGTSWGTAGIVIGRQRPDTASGVVFVTLEDETGATNVIVWRDLGDSQRRELLGSRLMAVYGKVEREGEVVHLLAGRLVDLTPMLGRLQTRSRDFH